MWCSGLDSNPGLRLSPIWRRKAEILGPVEFNLAIFGRRGALSFLLPEPKPEHHAIVPFWSERNRLCLSHIRPSTTISLVSIKNFARAHPFPRFNFSLLSKILSLKKAFRRGVLPQPKTLFQDVVPPCRRVECL